MKMLIMSIVSLAMIETKQAVENIDEILYQLKI